MSTSPTDRQEHTKFPPINEPVYLPDGRRLHRLRQSSMKDLDLCLERARINMSGLMPQVATDATAIGTAVHHGIELKVDEMIRGGNDLTLDNLKETAVYEFRALAAEPDFQWVDYKERGALMQIQRILHVWWYETLPVLNPTFTELTFGPLVLWEDDERVIEVTGTIDYGDRYLGLGDWKTAGRKYEAWEKERWDLQSTTYAYAASELGLDYLRAPDGSWPFTFFVYIKGSDVEAQRITVTRHEGDFAWLMERALSIALLIEAQLPSWPKNDNHALCSPKWCPAWSACKGKWYGVDWPKPSVPSEALLVAVGRSEGGTVVPEDPDQRNPNGLRSQAHDVKEGEHGAHEGP